MSRGRALVDFLLRRRRGGVHKFIGQQPRREDQPIVDLGAVAVLGEGEVGNGAFPKGNGTLGGVDLTWVNDVGLFGIEQAAPSQGKQEEQGSAEGAT